MMIAAATLAACAEGEQVSEAPEDAFDGNVAAPTAPRDSNIEEARDAAASAEPAPGQWFRKTRPDGPWAGYGPPNSEAGFSVRCKGERLVFSTTDVPPSGPGATEMRLSAAGVDRTLSAEVSERGMPSTEASVASDEEWLARLASASGKLTVRVGGSEPILVPISEPLTSLIRDCRR